MGRVHVEFDICNYMDIHLHAVGKLPADQVRRVRIDGFIDSGANQLVLPEAVARQLGLPEIREVEVTYSDRRVEKRKLVEGAHVALCGRTGIYSAIVEPNRTTALIGAIVLQDLDLLLDCRNHSVMPRNPEIQTTEVE